MDDTPPPRSLVGVMHAEYNFAMMTKKKKNEWVYLLMCSDWIDGAIANRLSQHRHQDSLLFISPVTVSMRAERPVCKFPFDFWVFRESYLVGESNTDRTKEKNMLICSHTPSCQLFARQNRLNNSQAWMTSMHWSLVEVFFFLHVLHRMPSSAVDLHPWTMIKKISPGQYSQRIMNVFLTRWCGTRRSENRNARARETAMGELSNHSWKVSNNSNTFFLGCWLGRLVG